MSQSILLGIDGGASKTAGVILDGEGQVLAHGRTGGSAIIGEPNPKSCGVLSRLVDSLCAEAGLNRDAIAHCGIGLNGIDFADQFAMQLAGLADAVGLPPARVTLVNDGIAALWGASPERASLIIQHGSGFTAAYRSDYGREELFDHLSVGHVADMRYGLTTLVARMILGMTPATPLEEATLAAYGVKERDYCEAIYRHRIPAERLRNTVPMIFEAWQRGDPAAAELVEAAIAEDAVAARAMIAKTGRDCPAVTLGGGQLRTAPPEFWRLLTAKLREHYPQVVASGPRLAPEFGAALMAAFQVGTDPAALFDALERQSAR
jgi:N-acetylglucosamine kinase-like BadF-type ATPase